MLPILSGFIAIAIANKPESCTWSFFEVGGGCLPEILKQDF
ncbi:hypothetical protein BOM_0465 [Borrelia miyamotoi FR64b]|nr:hypothetical protein BOM_0465 [Borrelia miyamotoi FR64b]